LFMPNRGAIPSDQCRMLANLFIVKAFEQRQVEDCCAESLGSG
jgi:hypothetical protein